MNTPKKSGGMASRRKGKVGEAQARNIILELTGVYLKRNTNQSDSGGYDLVVDLTKCTGMHAKLLAVELDNYAIEIKNTEKGFVPAYWQQTVEQAVKHNRVPLLMYKIPLKGWRVACYLAELLTSCDGRTAYSHHEDDVVHMNPVTFFRAVSLLKEQQ